MHATLSACAECSTHCWLRGRWTPRWLQDEMAGEKMAAKGAVHATARETVVSSPRGHMQRYMGRRWDGCIDECRCCCRAVAAMPIFQPRISKQVQLAQVSIHSNPTPGRRNARFECSQFASNITVLIVAAYDRMQPPANPVQGPRKGDEKCTSALGEHWIPRSERNSKAYANRRAAGSTIYRSRSHRILFQGRV